MKKILVLFCCLCAAMMLQAQSLNLLNSLSGMSPGAIDKLTEKQIGQIATEMETNRISVDQMESQAQQYGLSKQSAARLKRRLVRYSSVQAEKKAKEAAERDLEEYMLPEDEEEEIREPVEEEIYVLDKRTGKMVKKLQIFGLSTFRDANLTFEPNLRIATPEDEVHGRWLEAVAKRRAGSLPLLVDLSELEKQFGADSERLTARKALWESFAAERHATLTFLRLQ